MSAVLACECEGCGAACDGPARIAGVEFVLRDPCCDEAVYRASRPLAGPYERDQRAARDAGVPCHGEIA